MTGRAAVGLAVWLSVAGCGAGTGELSILTYNVAGLPQGISSSDPQRNIPQISPHLNNFDLVLVQEDFSYHRQLSANVTHPFASTPKARPEPGRLVADGLNRFSRFAFGEVERRIWQKCHGLAGSGAGDCLSSKGFSVARTTIGDGAVVDVYNLHVEAGGSAADNAARAVQVDQLLDRMRARSKGVAIVVAGDFNMRWTDPVDQPLLRKLAAFGLRDVCLEVTCGDDRIDRVYHRSSASLAFKGLSWGVPPQFVDNKGKDLSDHKPVTVRVTWSAR